MFEDAQGWRGTGKPPAARERAHHNRGCVTVTVSTHGLIKLRAQGCCHLSLSEVWGVHLLTPFFGLLGLGLHLGHLCGAQAKTQ